MKVIKRGSDYTVLEIEIIIMDPATVIIDGVICGTVTEVTLSKPELAPYIQVALEEWWEKWLNAFKKT